MKFKTFYLSMIILLLLTGKVYSQTLSGRILEAESHAPIPFVSVIYDAKKQLGTISNIDGYFTIPTPHLEGSKLSLNCMSYQDTLVTINPTLQEVKVYMKKALFSIPEVIIYPRENPAFAILRQVHKHKKTNNPENLSHFECKEYSQTTLAYDVSSIDSSSSKEMQKAAKAFKNKDAIFFETVYHRTYNTKTKHHLTVDGTRFPGMQEVPMYLPNDMMQPFHFYNDYVLLGDKKYLNPLGDRNFSRYRFHLKDSLIIDGIKNYVIDYYPKSELKYDALKGTLVISSYNWAIKTVTAEPFREDNIGVFILQNYTIVDGHWFPLELNYEMRYVAPSTVESPPFSFLGKSYISDVTIGDSIKNRTTTSYEIDVNDGAACRDSSYWNTERPVKLTQRQHKTFNHVDKKAKLDKYPFILEKVTAELKLPISIIDIDLTKIYSKNDFEGNRYGLGLGTNERLSQRVSIGGFLLYGTKDEAFKYGGDIELNIAKRTNFKTYLSYNNSYLKDDYFQDESTSNDNISSGDAIYNQDFLTAYKLGFKNTLKRLDIDYYVTDQRYLTYSDNINLNGITEHIFATGIYASFDYYRKNMRSWISPYKSINATSVAENRYIPTVNALFEQGFEFDRYNYDYSKVQLEIKSTFHLTKVGRIHYSLQAGKIWRDIPISKSFRGGSMYAKNTILLFEDAFQTVTQNEFTNAEYAYLFMNYKLGSINFKSRYSAPQIILYQNLGLGANNDSYLLDGTQAMDQLLSEAGIGIENIIRVPILNVIYIGGGAAAFCRYGNHSIDGGIQNNLAFKAILTLTY